MSRLNLDISKFKTLSECVTHAFRTARTLKGKTTILFSPGAASFEKFLHEFDRGAQFNHLVKKEVCFYSFFYFHTHHIVLCVLCGFIQWLVSK